MVKRGEIERFDCFRFPEPQNVAGVDSITEDRRVVRDALHFILWNPANAKAALVISESFCASTELHFIGDLWARDFPRVTVAQPFVRDLVLPAIADDLIENPELITDAVANCRHFNGGERIHVTRRKAAESAVAKSRLFFLRQDFIEIIA